MKKITFLFLLWNLLSACGSQTVSKEIQSTADTDTSVAELAFCNSFGGQSIQAYTQIYQSYLGQIHQSTLRVKIEHLFDQFEEGYNIHFIKWKADPTGHISSSPTPLDYRVVRDGYETPIGGYQDGDTFNFATLQDLYESTYNADFEIRDFISTHHFLIDLKDANGDYDALRVIVSDSNGTIVEELDSLIPIFHAHPSDYQYDGSENRAGALYYIHPLIKRDLNTMTRQDALNAMNQKCFMGRDSALANTNLTI